MGHRWMEPSVLVSDVLHEAWDARTSPARALVAPVEALAEGREGWGWRMRSWARHQQGQSLETARPRCAHVQTDFCA